MPTPAESIPCVLVVDRDRPETQELLEFLRERVGWRALWARDGEVAGNILEDREEELHAMVADAHTPRVDGMRLLRAALARRPGLCVVLLGDAEDLEAATEAVRAGAADYVARPLNLEKLAARLRQGVSSQQLQTEVSDLREQLTRRFGLERLQGRSRPYTEMMEHLHQTARSEAPVLLLGESGTGRQHLAHILHQHRAGSGGTFASVACAGVSDQVLEEEIFGSARGRGEPEHRGRVEITSAGTLYLDEGGDLPPRLQTRLLRLLTDGEFERAGDAEVRRSDARIVLSSSQDLPALVRRGKFRDDLYYRLSAATIRVPSLRDRKEDLPLLVQDLLEELNRTHGRSITGVTRGCMDLLMQYHWPGNTRELRNVLEGIVLFVEGHRPLEASHLPEYLRDRPPAPRDFRVRVGMSMAEIERRAIQETMAACGGNKRRTAAMLGVGLRTLYRKLKEYELE